MKNTPRALATIQHPQTKTDVLYMICGNEDADIANVMGVTRQAINQWPANINSDLSDRIVGRIIRLVKEEKMQVVNDNQFKLVS